MAAFEKFTYWIWGAPLLVMILTAGLFFTLKSRFFQFRRLWSIVKSPFCKESGGKGQMSPFEAVSMAVGGSVGVANISGVGTAIAVGGPGAMFWMWVASFLGMMIKMAEVTLASYYRRRDADGRVWGGPTYYMQEYLGREKKCRLWRVPAVLFGGGIFIGFFINVQNYAVSEAIGTTFDIPFMAPSLALAAVTYLMMAGGLGKMGRAASYLVPFMCVFYVGCVGAVLAMNAEKLLPSIGLIVKSALSLKPAVGGAAGTCMARAMKIGFARAVYSNEAGWGTSPMVHATAEVSHPVRQGLMGAFEVFADTIIVCTATGLLVISTDFWDSGLMGAELTLTALEAGLGGVARLIVTFSVFLFGLTSAVGWYAYYLTLLHHGIKNGRVRNAVVRIYTLLSPLMGVAMTAFAVFGGHTPDKIWAVADFSAAIPTFINVSVLLLMSGKFLELLSDFERSEAEQKRRKRH